MKFYSDVNSFIIEIINYVWFIAYAIYCIILLTGRVTAVQSENIALSLYWLSLLTHFISTILSTSWLVCLLLKLPYCAINSTWTWTRKRSRTPGDCRLGCYCSVIFWHSNSGSCSCGLAAANQIHWLVGCIGTTGYIILYNISILVN